MRLVGFRVAVTGLTMYVLSVVLRFYSSGLVVSGNYWD